MIFRGPQNFFWLIFSESCTQIFSSQWILPFTAIFVAFGTKSLHLLQKLKIPGNAVNRGNEGCQRERITYILNSSFFPTESKENIGEICLSKVIISIFTERERFSLPATLRQSLGVPIAGVLVQLVS